ncbi:MAG: nucleotide exchange factor GrpE [Betaproteobacteria bacterium]|jgi:Molecular chaperone GrpE (heat shock protein)|nr:nucleotide exchange factor GrpE [Betaproteobacteria bacterium]
MTPEEPSTADTQPSAENSPGMTFEQALAAVARSEETLRAKDDELLRLRAEMENLRKRTATELAQARKFALENFAGELLAVMDSLEAAQQVTEASIDSYRSGVELTARQLSSIFDKFHINAIHPEGQRFDPNRHQAIASLEHEEIPAQNVISVMQKGFSLHERILRPALVTVSKGKVVTTP